MIAFFKNFKQLNSFKLVVTLICCGLFFTLNLHAQTNLAKPAQINTISCDSYTPIEDSKKITDQDISSLSKYVCPLSLSYSKKTPALKTQQQTIETISHSALTFKPIELSLQPLVSSQELIDTLDFKKDTPISSVDFKNLGQIAAIYPGKSKLWVLTVGGIKVLDLKSDSWSFTTALSIDQVRPKDAYLNEDQDSLWLFGKDLYQYKIQSNQIFRYKPQQKAFNVIRKIQPVANGLWLATDKGVFFFEDKTKQFYQLPVKSTAFTQVAAGKEGVVWFANSQAQLFQVTMRDKQTAKVNVSEPLELNSLVDMLYANGTLMMLVNQNKGKQYHLAYIKDGLSELSHTNLDLFLLKKVDEQVYGTQYEKLFAIEKDLKLANMLDADIADIGNATIGKQVLFTGASYVVTNGTAEVKRSVVDISKGWKQPLSTLFLQGWDNNQPSYMNQYLPLLIDTQSAANELWFVLGNNSELTEYDAQFLLRYSKQTHQAKLYYSRWDTAPNKDTVVYKVKNLTTTVSSDADIQNQQ